MHYTDIVGNVNCGNLECDPWGSCSYTCEHFAPQVNGITFLKFLISPRSAFLLVLLIALRISTHKSCTRVFYVREQCHCVVPDTFHDRSAPSWQSCRVCDDDHHRVLRNQKLFNPDAGSRYAHMAPRFPPITATAVSGNFQNEPHLRLAVRTFDMRTMARTRDQSLPRPPANLDSMASSRMASKIPYRSSGTVLR